MSDDVSGAVGSPSGFWALALLGPPMGGLLVLYMAGAAPLTLQVLLAALAPSYAVGLPSALLVGGLDIRLARRGRGATCRLFAAGVSGAFSSFLLLGPLYASGLIHGTTPLLLCLVAAAAATICLSVFLMAVRLFV